MKPAILSAALLLGTAALLLGTAAIAQAQMRITADLTVGQILGLNSAMTILDADPCEIQKPGQPAQKPCPAYTKGLPLVMAMVNNMQALQGPVAAYQTKREMALKELLARPGMKPGEAKTEAAWTPINEKLLNEQLRVEIDQVPKAELSNAIAAGLSASVIVYLMPMLSDVALPDAALKQQGAPTFPTASVRPMSQNPHVQPFVTAPATSAPMQSYRPGK